MREGRLLLTPNSWDKFNYDDGGGGCLLITVFMFGSFLIIILQIH